MDIFERLQNDHERQRELLRQIADTSGDSGLRRELFEALRLEADAHANAEEQTLYALMVAEDQTQEQARHSIAEHYRAAKLVSELQDLDFGSGGWIHKFEKLRDKLLHHIDEEEEDVFPAARKLISDDEARRMSDEFVDRKNAEIDQLREAS